ncbi:hypothetical protein V5E97_28270 [Singulisphaera sp. Ch08]|uniref:Uncharacterized protein n=1 Tax=Singulisphaera sp. Ch08 TaxID=3120278 RepID=A0AAU7CAN6_9BACT
MRGAAIHNEPGSGDPLLRAIAELRDQIDRLIDEQQVALEGFASGLDGDWGAVDRSVLAAEEASDALLSTHQVSAPRVVVENHVPAVRASEPTPKWERLARPEVSNPVDEPSAMSSTSSPISAAPREPGAEVRSDDPKERLDALVKHFDRMLRRSGTPPAGASGPPS